MVRFDFILVTNAKHCTALQKGLFNHWQMEDANENLVRLSGIVFTPKDLVAFGESFKNIVNSVDIFLDSDDEEKFVNLGYKTFPVAGGVIGINLPNQETFATFLDHVK